MFLTKQSDFGVLRFVELRKTNKTFCVHTGGTQGIHGRNPLEGSAGSVGSDSGIPRKYTGGTHVRDPPAPPALKTGQNVFLTRKTIFEFFENS